MNFTGKYLINSNGELLEVSGQKYDNTYAIIYDHRKKLYGILHVSTGSLLSKGFDTLQQCILNADSLIRRGNRVIEKNPEILKIFHVSFFNCKIN